MNAPQQGFKERADAELKNAVLKIAIDRTTGNAERKRAVAVAAFPEFQAARARGRAIKDHVIAHLDHYLEMFERNATAAGATVHWASDDAEARAIITRICLEADAKLVTRAKSMLGEEIGLPHALADAGIERVETDLAEHIIQLAGERPSHIVWPAMHRTREQVAILFKEAHHPPPAADDPATMVQSARRELRAKFLGADVGISGANFLVADTGATCTVTNEGNADLSGNVPKLQIHSIGIEKLIPRIEYLGVFIRLLSRSALGSPITQYTSHFRGPRAGTEMHMVLVDNGRSERLGMEEFWTSLKCIRCGACMNICPVYQHAGGHAYGSVYPGPIGISLTPQLTGMKDHNDPSASLPYACSLCGRCDEVCPVKIPLSDVILENRHQKVTHATPPIEPKLFKTIQLLWSNPKLWNKATHMVALGRILGGTNKTIESLPLFMSGWSEGRDTAVPPKKSFRQWFESEEGKELLAEAREESKK